MSDKHECTCAEINARHCSAHQEPDEIARLEEELAAARQEIEELRETLTDLSARGESFCWCENGEADCENECCLAARAALGKKGGE